MIPGELLKQGWGVVRLKPWHLAGIFASSAEAENLARALGPDYAVKYGDHVAGSPDFSFALPPDGPSV
jgi:hypothetical protein